MKAHLRRLALGGISLAVAAAIWLPCLHLFFRPRLETYFAPNGIPPRARAIAERHLQLWSDPAQRSKELLHMRAANREWDFMGRTFLVLALANMSLRDPGSSAGYLRVIDDIIDDTLAIEREHGMYFFLMDYARAGSYVSQPPHSLFIDGEIALMLGARRLVQEQPEYRLLMTDRINAMTEYMGRSAVLSGESYPNECWMFCNTIALASVRIADVLDHTDHSPFINRWLESAKEKLTDPHTGLLVSSYTYDGQPMDGPEGSSIWMVSHCLLLIDESLAQDQYRRAKKELARTVLGFGFAREWPESWHGPTDVDSGPIVPGLEISAGSSGLAFVGAASFGDDELLSQLLTTLDFAGFPEESDGARKYTASNQVGDAVLLYALVQGPLWQRVRELQQK